ncbi:MAG: Asp-tRNA(Asn)/Glu-tRNA(Gln) amidotransferase subunit GatC [Candidatus Bathyarchaeia archaeon]|nr:Asp-tRNA(Asn)/Glu-tRNA(Gln) amidotransferase subunit GatC [Candidatus Bathyarchaeota archaeon]
MREKWITKEEIEHIAQLAHIELTDEEKEVFTEQFNRILDFFRKIDEVDTRSIPPMYHVLDIVNVYREDEVGGTLPKESVLENAPKKEEQFFKSPRIV